MTSYVYSLSKRNISISTAITIAQIKAGAASPLEIIRMSLTQRGSTASAQEEVQIVRKTAAATVTAFTPLLWNPNDPASDAVGGTAATGYLGTAEGTDGDVLLNEGFNVLNGWLFLPTPEERIMIKAAGIIALKFPNAPAAQNWDFNIVWREIKG